MKKILSLVSILTIICGSTTNTVSCNNLSEIKDISNINEISPLIINTNDKNLNDVFAVTKVNRKEIQILLDQPDKAVIDKAVKKVQPYATPTNDYTYNIFKTKDIKDTFIDINLEKEHLIYIIITAKEKSQLLKGETDFIKLQLIKK
ncbi:spiralin [Spiroplasma melliferum]|uniref:Spiralin n=2 Tax=Spiroplasma melliferum TaxID=2134 RepID=A0AAI9T324_SPIME|nr:spiralin [Spiroplasma melliferum]ELL44181.1 putative spiralin [Spiroplasma melliferum IPMB4A]KAI92311.1 spiralin [Spiroplasma melliferum KC3]QCO23744.1 spiralin [Spiroplasma melliferum]